MELKQWTIVIALFYYYVPPSCVCYCRAVGYVGVGAKAESAESEHSISNNLKFCVVIFGLLFLKWLAGKWVLGLSPGGIKCQITRYVNGVPEKVSSASVAPAAMRSSLHVRGRDAGYSDWHVHLKAAAYARHRSQTTPLQLASGWELKGEVWCFWVATYAPWPGVFILA